jgi:hypothetical protein
MAKTKWQMISSNSFQNSSSAKLQCRITCFLPEKKNLQEYLEKKPIKTLSNNMDKYRER